MQAAPAGVWPVTVAGWVTLISFPITVGVVIFGWGRFFGKLETILGKIASLEVNQQECIKQTELVEADVSLIKITLWGVRGDNGLSSDIKTIKLSLGEIKDRNTRLDAVREREDGARRVGEEQRIYNRRREDQILRDEDIK